MKVSELIAELQDYPADMPVAVRSTIDNNFFTEPVLDNIEVITFANNKVTGYCPNYYDVEGGVEILIIDPEE